MLQDQANMKSFTASISIRFMLTSSQFMSDIAFEINKALQPSKKKKGSCNHFVFFWKMAPLFYPGDMGEPTTIQMVVLHQWWLQ